jgi:hypothetical protein
MAPAALTSSGGANATRLMVNGSVSVAGVFAEGAEATDTQIEEIAD